MNYSEKDFNSLYFTLKKTIGQKTNYNLDEDPSYKNSLNIIIRDVIKKNPQGSNQFINSVVVNSVTKKFIDRINKSKNKTTCNNFPQLANRPLNTDPRPQASQFPPRLNDPFSSNRNVNVPEMKPDMFSRSVNQNSRDEVDMNTLRETPEERMNKLMKERGLANEKSLKVAEGKLDNGKVPIENDNDFFKIYMKIK